MSNNCTVEISSLNVSVSAMSRAYIVQDTSMYNVCQAQIPFLLEGKIRRVANSVDSNIGTAEINYPNRPFGTRVEFGAPFVIFVENGNNVLMRGFIVDEVGELNTKTDSLTLLGYDHKWILNNLPKIYGKIYAVDGAIETQDNPRLYVRPNFDKYDMFKYSVPEGSPKRINNDVLLYLPQDGCGFIFDEKTIFNKDGMPDCAGVQYSSNGPTYNRTAFKFKPDKDFKDRMNIRGFDNDTMFYWDYATILYYIYTYYIRQVLKNYYSGNDFIKFAARGMSMIYAYAAKYGGDLIIPKNFDITGLTPAQAIDKVVKNIPGLWMWRLIYVGPNTLIDIVNIEEFETLSEYSIYQGKSVVVGNGGKLFTFSNNNANVKSISARVSIKDAASYAIAYGGPVQIETSVEYIPDWPRYLRPFAELSTTDQIDANDWTLYEGGPIPNGRYLSSFKNQEDYNNWVKFINLENTKEEDEFKQLINSLTPEDLTRYSRIFRAYSFPQRKRDLARYNKDIPISTVYSDFSSYVSYVHELLFDHILRIRKVHGPATDWNPDSMKSIKKSFYNKIPDPTDRMKDRRDIEYSPFVFLYDVLRGSLKYEDEAVTIDDSTTRTRILSSMSFIIPFYDSTKKNDLDYSFEQDNTVIIFKEPQFTRKTVSLGKTEQFVFPEFRTAQPRNVFVSCRFDLDVSLVAQDKSRISLYKGLKLVNSERKEDLTIVLRVGAYYPVKDGTTQMGKSLTYTGTSTNTDRLTGYLTKGEITNYSKLTDYNDFMIDQNGQLEEKNSNPIIITDESQLKQLLQILLNDRPYYEEEYGVELARLDMSFQIGDRITDVINSELDDGSGGYFSMNAIVEAIEHSPDSKVSNKLSTKMKLKNFVSVKKKVED